MGHISRESLGTGRNMERVVLNGRMDLGTKDNFMKITYMARARIVGKMATPTKGR